jgi:hypothetical protein
MLEVKDDTFFVGVKAVDADLKIKMNFVNKKLKISENFKLNFKKFKNLKKIEKT